MDNQEEFEIIEIEKDLKEESKKAVTKSTLLAIASTIMMTSGLMYAYKNNITPAIGTGLSSILFGISSGMEMNKSANLDKKIKSLRK